MKRAFRTITALSGSLLLMAAAAGTASANYGGYGDGAPGPADVWAATHANFGKVMGTRHVSRSAHDDAYYARHQH